MGNKLKFPSVKNLLESICLESRGGYGGLSRWYSRKTTAGYAPPFDEGGSDKSYTDSRIPTMFTPVTATGNSDNFIDRGQVAVGIVKNSGFNLLISVEHTDVLGDFSGTCHIDYPIAYGDHIIDGAGHEFLVLGSTPSRAGSHYSLSLRYLS